MKIISHKNILQFCLIAIFTLLSTNIFSQDTTNVSDQEYFPHDANKVKEEKQVVSSKDSIVVITKTKEKPGNLVGNILLYLSPNKEETVTLSYPYPVESDDTIVLSNHEVELQNYENFDDKIKESEWIKISKIKLDTTHKNNKRHYDTVRLNKQVYGYHPYWMGNAYKSYDFGLLSRVAYFSLPVEPKTGDFTTKRLWESTDLIQDAHVYNCKVDLCINLFGSRNNAIFLENEKAQDNLIKNLKKALVRRNFLGKIEVDKYGRKVIADGVNINFEGIGKNNKEDFVNFIKKLDTELGSNYKITVTLPAIDWRNAYDIVKLQEHVDFFFLMAYDFYGKYSKQAGPNSLLYSGGTWETVNISNTVENYIKLGINKKKLIVGLPYYGNEWQTKSDMIPSEKVEFVGARTYSYIAKYYTENTVKTKITVDTVSQSVCYTTKRNGKWIQCWADNETTLGVKYDYIINKELGGAGIWALGYDNGYYDLWDLIAEKFTSIKDPDKEIKKAIDMSLASNVITRSNDVVKTTTPKYQTRFYNKINRFWNFFALFFAIVMIFAIVGFIVAISDFDVRFVLFNKEVRVYMFFIFISILAMFFLRIADVVLSNEIYMIIAIVLGIVFALMVLKIGNMKKEKQGEERP